MSWERRGERRYYTRTRKVKGRRVRQYVGIGPAAELAAQLDARLRAEREARWQARRDLEADLLALEAPGEGLCKELDALMRAALLAAGYYQHDHGEWRPRRHEHQANRPGAQPGAAPAGAACRAG